MPRLPGNSSKNWVFTLNNYNETSYEDVWRRIELHAKYAIVGREVGDSGTPHLQGYVQFPRRHNLSTVRALIHSGAHFEPARGGYESNKSYCSKDGNYREFGEPSTTQGGRPSRDSVARRYVELQQQSRGLGSISEFADENPGVYYFSGHNLRRNFLEKHPPINRPAIEVKWVWGKPGVGKSRMAHELYPDAYIKEPKTKWWNGYMLECEVIIDDYGPLCVDINHLLRWFDRYKCLVECKHGMMPLYAYKFIVTSNFHPAQIFKFGDETHPQLPALERRMEIIEM